MTILYYGIDLHATNFFSIMKNISDYDSGWKEIIEIYLPYI